MNKLHNQTWSALRRSKCSAFAPSTITLFLLITCFGMTGLYGQTGCLSQLNVTLGAQCATVITPETVLTGTIDPDNLIEISIDGLTDTLRGCGLHEYVATVTDPMGTVLLECWGNILAEDKTPPALACPEGTNEAVLRNDMQVLRGDLLVDSPTFDPAVYSCYQEMDPPLESGARAYHLNTFSITTTDIYTFIGAAEYDGIIGLYQGEFFPEDPCRNLIAQTDDTYNGSVDNFNPVVPAIAPSLRLSLTLRPGRTYTLVWTSRELAVTGDYGVAVFADGNGRVASLSKIQVDLSAELVCLDLEEVVLPTGYTYSVFADGSLVLDFSDPFRIPQELRNILNFTGFPEVTDNCGDMLVTVYDEVEEAGDCGVWTITRTFSVADRYNSPCEDPALISTCTQIITVRKPTLDDIILPPFTAILECDEGFPTDGEQGGPDDNPAPEYTGYPYLSTGLNFYDLNPSACNLGASYYDEPRIITCPGGYYFRREWNIVDWCSPDDNLIYQQYIRVGDFTGPDISFSIPDYDLDGLPDSIYQYSTAPASCLANIVLPEAIVNDGNGCSGVADVTVSISDEEGAFVAIASPSTLVQLPIGDFTLSYCATDSCANQNCAPVDLQVRDRIAPTAVCTNALLVSIGGGETGTGTATLSAVDLDEGSSDGCGPVTLAIRRDQDSVFTENVLFDCTDLGDTIKVHLLVTDTAQNENTCWLEVVPEDKLRPFCIPPTDLTFSCVEFPQTLPNDLGIAYITNFGETSQLMTDLFGGATGTDNCAVDTLVERSPDLSLNECGWGTILRRFEAWQLLPAGDVNGNGAIDIGEVLRSNNTCTQLITVTEIHQFVIDFPQDVAAECGSPNVPGVLTESLGCDVLAISTGEPQIFAATGEECYKYAITYDVINWCLWDGEYEGFTLERQTEDDGEDLATDRAVEGNERPVVRYNNISGLVIDRRHTDRDGDSSLPNTSPTLPDYGRYLYTQFIKVYDATAPEIEIAYYGGPTDLCPDLTAGQFGDVTGNCSAPVSIDFSLNDACAAAGNNPALTVTILSVEIDEFALDADGNGTIDFNEFTTDRAVSELVVDNGNGSYQFADELPVIPFDSPFTYHALRILFEDGCGNRTSETILIEVLDCKAPAPICINGLTVTLMPQPVAAGGCAMTIWASDFEGSAIYDCSGRGPETENGLLRVDRYAVYRASTVAADPSFVPQRDHTNLTLTETDEETTIVYIYAFDEAGNYDFCETYVLVQQHLDCSVTTGSVSGLITTEQAEAVAGVEVSISGQPTTPVVTDQDGMYAFDNLSTGEDLSVVPYLNTNPVNGVTTFDLVLISKHILGIDPLDSPYRMIAADANHSESITTLDMIQLRKLILQINTEFPSNTSWRFVATDYTFPDLTNPWHELFPEVVSQNDFAGALAADFIGIKIGDVNGNVQVNSVEQEARVERDRLTIPLEELQLVKGHTYSIPVMLPSSGLDGLQFALALDGVDLNRIHYGRAEAGHLNVLDGQLLVSWHDLAQDLDDNRPLFTLEITARTNLPLSRVLHIDERLLPAEAYYDNQQFQLALAFNRPAAKGLTLEQNIPNPFQKHSRIGFTLPRAARVVFTITDVRGQVINQTTEEYVAGHHSLLLTPEFLQHRTGILLYTLATAEETVSKKMIVLP